MAKCYLFYDDIPPYFDVIAVHQVLQVL